MNETQTTQETEYVGILKIDSEPGWCAFGIDNEASVRHLIEEAKNLIDGSVDDIDAPPLVTIEVRCMPKGWVEALPEFEGW